MHNVLHFWLILNDVTKKRLSGHPHIISFISAANIPAEQSGIGRHEYLLLTEFCPGSLISVLQGLGNESLPLPEVLKVFYQTCKSVQHMHNQQPPIVHRDLKVNYKIKETLE